MQPVVEQGRSSSWMGRLKKSGDSGLRSLRFGNRRSANEIKCSVTQLVFNISFCHCLPQISTSDCFEGGHYIKMRASTFTVLFSALLTTTQAAIKTSIWIDQVPGYSALAPCAENRVSAIVRAQASGCGDNLQLTSFSCFCIDRSSQMSSIISTAVQDYCATQATTLTASLTTALPEVTSAIEVFNSYCAQSTELVWCMSLTV